MYIEILSVSKKKEQDNLPEREDELRQHLAQYGFTLNAVKKTLLNSALINKTLNEIASSEDKPDVVIIANALRTQNDSSFRKYFVETVAAAERAENEPAPKDYWKRRNKAFARAKKEHADAEAMAALEKRVPRLLLCLQRHARGMRAKGGADRSGIRHGRRTGGKAHRRDLRKLRE